MKKFILIICLFFYKNIYSQVYQYHSIEQNIVLANSQITDIKKNSSTYICFQKTKTLEHSYFYMSDAPYEYPQNLKKTWSKEYKMVGFNSNTIFCKDVSGNDVSFVIDEFSDSPSVTMIIFYSGKPVKKVIYYID